MASRPLVFRRSVRLFAVRLMMLMLITFGGLMILMWPDWKAALGISAVSALVASAWYYVTRHRVTSITVDDENIVQKVRGEEVRIRWVDVTNMGIGETLLPLRSGTVPVRFCIIRGLGTRKIVFADLTYVDNRPIWIGTNEPTLVTDIADSDVLLGLAAEKLEDARFLPDVPEETDEEGAEDVGEEPIDGAQDDEGSKPRSVRLGLVALATKLGVNLAKPILALFKGSQGLLALASMGALALLFSWQGAVATMVMLLFHEYGHVHAMRRSGIPVKGIYFIPLVGAAAVAEDVWKTRRQQAIIALAGPLWGAALTLVPLAVVVATGDRYPLAGGIAAWWALINLLNLLPITPLDGGRVLSAVGYSIHSRVGLALPAVLLLAGTGLAIWAEMYLFVILLPVGLLELSGERAAATRIKRLEAAPALAGAAPEELVRLRVLTRPGFPQDSEIKLRQMEVARIRRLLKLARIEPMSGRQGVLWFGLYVALGVALAGMILWLASVFSGLDALLTVVR